ncbi:MAG: hypothetical protein ABFC34_15175 [Methanobacterium sp.]
MDKVNFEDMVHGSYIEMVRNIKPQDVSKVIIMHLKLKNEVKLNLNLK